MGKNKRGRGGQSKNNQDDGNKERPQDSGRLEQIPNPRASTVSPQSVDLSLGESSKRHSESSQYGVRVLPKTDAPDYRSVKDESGQKSFEGRARGRGKQQLYKNVPEVGEANIWGRQQQNVSSRDNKQKQQTNAPDYRSIKDGRGQKSFEERARGKGKQQYQTVQEVGEVNPWGRKQQNVSSRDNNQQQQQKPFRDNPQTIQKTTAHSDNRQPQQKNPSETVWNARRQQVFPSEKAAGKSLQTTHTARAEDKSSKRENADPHKKSDSDKIICVSEKKFTPGILGRRIKLITNHFELLLGEVKTAVLYDVAFEPDRPKRLLKEAYRKFREVHFGDRNPAFDGRKYVYSVNDLPFGDSISDTVTITNDVTNPMEFKVTMTRIKTVDLEPLKRFALNKNGTIELTMASIQALDIILGHTAWMQNIKVGASYFAKPESPFDLGGGMVLYRGCFQSVSLGSKLFLNVDVANKAFPKKQNVIYVIGEVCRYANVGQPLDDRNLQALSRYIQNLKIEYCVPNKPSSKRHYTVNGIHHSAASTMFSYEPQPGQSKRVTVEEYYRMVYSTKLQYPQMPCLWVGPRNKTIYLPCELCTVLPNQVVQNKLDPFQTSKMIKFCATDTTERKRAIQSCVQKADYNNDPVVNEFDLRVSEDFKELDGRVLLPPELLYRNGGVKVSKGVWRAKEFIEPARIDTWTIISLDYQVRTRNMEDLARALINGSRSVGMELGQPVKPFREVRLNELMKTLEGFKNVRIVFVVVSDGVYKKVKQQAEQAVGCLTQCLTRVTVLNKLNITTISNILLKVNAKCGGVNHVLFKPPPKMKEPMMIMGADVTHPSPHSAEPSVAAVTASHDLAGSKYNLSCRIQKPTLEIIYDLENMTREHILYFRKNTGTLPVRIIFYRDGVSTGQFNIVLNSEFQAIRRACNRIQENYNPSVTLVVVQKRHHTRLFPVNGADTEDKNGNVPAGTCVDTDIVLPNYQNFYLVSHASIQGVARPTKYVTLSDDNNFSNDELQLLTYYLCHMYTRCTRSVSYPAPTYYAHLAALRGKAYIDMLRFDLNNLEREQRRFTVKEEIIKGLPMFFV